MASGPLDLDLQKRLSVAVHRLGERRVWEAIGIDRHTIGRACAGFGIHAGNRALVEAKIASVEALKVTPKPPKGRP